MDLVNKLRALRIPCSKDSVGYDDCDCSLGERAARAVGALRAREERLQGQVSAQADTLNEQREEIDKLGAQVERQATTIAGYQRVDIEKLRSERDSAEEENAQLRQERDSARAEIAALHEYGMYYDDALRQDRDFWQNRANELIEQSNSQFDEIVGAIADLAQIRELAAEAANRLDK